MTTGGDNGSCCGRRTTLEKFLIVESIFLALAVIGLVVGIIIVAQDAKEVKEKEKTEEKEKEKEGEVIPPVEDVCDSAGCIHAASNVLRNMNPEIDPCDDFYEFACGNFLTKTVIPNDKASVSSFTAIGDELEVKLNTIIEGIEPGEPKYAQLASRLYKSCLNTEDIEKKGLTVIKGIITELGEWPVVTPPGSSESYNWVDFVRKARELGYSTNNIISLNVDIDWKNTKRHYIELDQPSLGISKEYLDKGKDTDQVKAYLTYMIEVAKQFGATNPGAETQMEEVLDFEIKLAEISLSRENRRDYNKLYHVEKLSKVKKDYEVVTDWTAYIKDVLNNDDVTIDDDEDINVAVPEYFTKLKGILEKYDGNESVIQNYLVWRVVMDSISYLTDELRDLQLTFLGAISGIKERPKRWKECVSVTTDRLPIAAASLYVRKHFDEEARVNANKMVIDIKDQFQEILKSIDWMDEETREKALQKAETMSSHIAYPEELINDDRLAEYYEKLIFEETDTYLNLILNRNKFMIDKSFGKLRDDVDKDHWTLHANAAVVNAFYNFLYNSIEFPAGILQGVFFDNERPRYMNYGGIGFVIGHEITHGFDDQGRQFDHGGNLANWWSEDVLEKFKVKAKCVIDQYSKYNVKEIIEGLDMTLNGVNTQGENIADNGGIKEAYLAYKTSVARGEVEKRLPGLKYTPEQMFWISAANIWCIKYTKLDLENRVLTGVHSPGRFRVIGPMTNLKYFADDFNCAAGTKMNPEKKCEVW